MEMEMYMSRELKVSLRMYISRARDIQFKILYF